MGYERVGNDIGNLRNVCMEEKLRNEEVLIKVGGENNNSRNNEEKKSKPVRAFFT